ncbi:MAG: hypothetical protein U9N45_01080, partial [Gemmatimonadota bacterium]|nr:hypothetical protein [Gemmatimonadota bacterium]
ESVLAVGEDIRYIKEKAQALEEQGKPLSGSIVFWLLHLVPLLSIPAALFYRRHRGLLLSDQGYARLRGSGKRLARRLKEASKAIQTGEWAASYAALDKALLHFISDKLNVETVGMLTEEIDELLAGRNIDDKLREELLECLDHFAFVRFAPQTGADEDSARKYLKKVSRLINSLDKVI